MYSHCDDLNGFFISGSCDSIVNYVYDMRNILLMMLTFTDKTVRWKQLHGLLMVKKICSDLTLYKLTIILGLWDVLLLMSA